MLKREFVHNISLDSAYKILHHMGECFIQTKYADNIRRFEFDMDIGNSRIQSCKVSPLTIHPTPKHLKYDCFIGVKSLIDNMDENRYVRDLDLVLCAKHIAHEAWHLHRNLETYQEPLSDYYLDMARMEAISSCFKGYRTNTYFYLPSEIDAEIHGLLNTVSYLDRLVDEDGEPIDVKACLFERYRELPTNRVWRSHQPVTCFDDMIRSLENQKQNYLYTDRGFPLLEADLYDRAILTRLNTYHVWQDVLYTSDRIGVSYDEKLFAMLIDVNKLWVQTHAGIQEESTRIVNLYPRQIPTPGEETFQDIINALGKLKNHDEQQL